MEQYLIPYFTAEKQEALLFMLVGVLALAVSAALLAKGGPYKGMLYPLAAVAVIQLVVGSTVYFRTDAQVAELTAQYQSDPAGFRTAETQRMDVVVKNFVLYRYIELALLLAGLALLWFMRHNEFWYAVGIGLSLQAGLMLALDYFAEKRAGEYLQFVLGT
jgi:hypothetical protein